MFVEYLELAFVGTLLKGKAWWGQFPPITSIYCKQVHKVKSWQGKWKHFSRSQWVITALNIRSKTHQKLKHVYETNCNGLHWQIKNELVVSSRNPLNSLEQIQFFVHYIRWWGKTNTNSDYFRHTELKIACLFRFYSSQETRWRKTALDCWHSRSVCQG